VLIPAGEPAPALVGQTLDGQPWADSLTGQVTIVEFFATWCPHCRRSLAGYHALADARQVRLIIVDVGEEPELVRAFFSRNPPPPNSGVVLDPMDRAAKLWGVTGYPVAYLVDQKGIIRMAFSGWGEGSARKLAKEIDRLQGGEERAAASAAGKAKRARRARGKSSPPGERTVGPDEHARQLGVEVIR
jgi:thiol-disulfide isomerase/thioredoxin